VQISTSTRFIHGLCLFLLEEHKKHFSYFSVNVHPLYCRQLYTVRDGGTVALDWFLASDLEGMGLLIDCRTVISYIIYGDV
jgi:hypothetical protein